MRRFHWIFFWTSVLWMALLWGGLPQWIPPAEDAVILFRYSENLAHTGQITYNPNGPVSEGATDFLWMLLLAIGVKVGLSPFITGLGLSILAIMASAYALNRFRLSGRSEWIVTAGVLAMTPPMFAGLNGFSPLFFGALWLWVLTAFYEQSIKSLLWASLLLGLTRPEGVLLAVPLCLVAMIKSHFEWRDYLPTVLLCTVIGGAYFIWRWQYFDMLLPLPFYIKSSFTPVMGLFHEGALHLNISIALMVALPMAYLAHFGSDEDDDWMVSKKELAVYAVLWPVLVYSAFSLSQNIGFRFQYPILLGGLYWLSRYAKHYLQFRWSMAVVLILLVPLTFKAATRTLINGVEQVPDVARALAEALPQGDMAVTEAGRWAYYSGWTVTDLWGLNTPALARQVVQPDTAKALQPDMWVLHSYRYDRLGQAAVAKDQRSWQAMLDNVVLGLNMADYEQWMLPVFDFSRPLPEPIRQIIYYRQVLRWQVSQWQGQPLPFRDYHMILLPRNAPNSAIIRGVLTDHQAIPYATYIAEKKAAEDNPRFRWTDL